MRNFREHVKAEVSGAPPPGTARRRAAEGGGPPGVGACVGPPARGPAGAGKTVPIHSRPASLLPEARRNRPPRLSVAGCATGSARFSSAQLDRGGPLCLYTSGFPFPSTHGSKVAGSVKTRPVHTELLSPPLG